LSSQLRAVSDSVVALEPSLAMLTRLRGGCPKIAGAAGRAEALPFGNHSFDVVTIAQAFHWFDQSEAVAEFVRVLRPAGRVGLLWNLRDEAVSWVADLSQLIGSEGSGSEEWMDAFGAHAAFGPLERRSFWFEQPLDRDLLIALVRSRSYVATLPEPEQTALLAQVGRLCDEHPSLSGRSWFTMPYRTEVFRTDKLA
jgi:SAM-dependent methyltransferase